MKLFFSATSPYARKIRIALREKGLIDQVQEVPVDPHGAPDALTAHNPLSLIPTLVTQDGTALYDSPVILSWLDQVAGRDHGPRLLPGDGGPQTWAFLTRHALADGIVDAAIIMVLEGRRPQERQHQPAIDKERRRIVSALDQLEADAAAGQLSDQPRFDTIAILCALEYLDFRLRAVVDWRLGRPALAAWAPGLAERAACVATRPPAA